MRPVFFPSRSSIGPCTTTGGRSAAVATLIETAKRNGVDPQGWLANTLARIGQDTPAPIFEEIAARIAQLYAIEKEIRGKDPDTRKAVRQKWSEPIFDALRPWLEVRLLGLSSASDLARYIRCL